MDSELWTQFVAARKTGQEPVLPDFSYAGYHRGERPIPDIDGPIFDVTDYGAVPDDNESDEAAIRAAVAAATTAGGGVVFFPPGRYLAWTDRLDRTPIVIETGHIVLRGSGAGRDGTIIHQVHHGMHNPDPEFGYGPGAQGVTCSTLFTFQPPSREKHELTVLTRDARRETMTIEVEDPGSLHPGQWISIDMFSAEANRELIQPYEPKPNWTRLLNAEMGMTELHQVKSLDGSIVTLEEPLHQTFKACYRPVIMAYPTLEEIGVEDLCFMGNWLGHFVHHRSCFDDGAWSPLILHHAVNSWIRRCSFVNETGGMCLFGCSACTALHLRFEGPMGHGGMHARSGNGVLLGLFQDTTGHEHGPGLGYGAAATVYWRGRMTPGQAIDAHSGIPYATLLDRIDGGTLMWSGGPESGFPNHLRHLVVWNFAHNGGTHWAKHYEFWREGRNRPIFIKPILVGLHGNPVGVVNNTVQVNESQGTPVTPESLYEAQVTLRLGALPDWVGQAHADADTWRHIELPEHLDLTHVFPAGMNDRPETFDVADCIRDAAAIPFRGGEYKQMVPANATHIRPCLQLADRLGTMTADWNKVLIIVYDLLVVAGQLADDAVTLTAERDDGDDRIRLAVSAGPASTRFPVRDRGEWLFVARLCTALGGKAGMETRPDGLLWLTAELPA